MSEYTPTTEDLIEAYAMSGDGLDFKRAANERREAAREALAAHDAEVRADEAEQWAQAVIVSGKQGERIGAAQAGAVASSDRAKKWTLKPSRDAGYELAWVDDLKRTHGWWISGDEARALVAGVVAEGPAGGDAGAIGAGDSPRVTGHSTGPRGRQRGTEHSTKIDAPASPTDEPDWEYRTLLDGADPQPHGRLSRGEITPVEWFANRHEDGRNIALERRTSAVPAGPWVPVKQEGAEK